MRKIDIIQKEIQESRELAWEAYAKEQANGEIPAWLVLNGGTYESRVDDGIWDVTGYLWKAQILPDGIVWERRKDGSKELVRYDSETGEKGIVISYDLKDEERVDFFHAEVDLASGLVTLKHSIAVEDLRAEDFWLNYDNFDMARIWRFDQSWEQNWTDIFGSKANSPWG